MGLSGNFKDTSFADLLQFYSVSRQTVAVSVRLSSGERVDGTFYFADGDLVGARLADAEGREAVRRALRLREGAFTVEIGARPAAPASREALKNVVREEVGLLQQERGPRPAPPQPGARHAGATAAGGAFQAAGTAASRAPGSAAAPQRRPTAAMPAAGARPAQPAARPAPPG
ncbi:MAG TPA: DUF4388 domain-containing protein, partial [Anaeromyxobacter sp.]|nr:DUF4388 domain-containing protein [Anaeromyxobacter sp.]